MADAYTVVVIGGNPGQQLKTYDANRSLPPTFYPFDRNEVTLWHALAVAAGTLEPDASPEQLLKLLQDAKVDGYQDAIVVGEMIGEMSTLNPRARFTKVEFGSLKGYFRHRNGTRTARLTVADLDLDAMLAERGEQARARYREFTELIMGLDKPPLQVELARRHVERGLTFHNAVHRGMLDWLAHPFVQKVLNHRWAPDETQPQRGEQNFIYQAGLANDFDPMKIFCQEYPEPEAEFIRREQRMAAVPWIYVHNSEWHDHLEEALNNPETLQSGQAALQFRDDWAAGVHQLYRTLPPFTRLTAATVKLT